MRRSSSGAFVILPFFPAGADFRLAVHAHHVFADNDGNAAPGRRRWQRNPSTSGRYEGGSQGAGHHGHAGLGFDLVAEFGGPGSTLGKMQSSGSVVRPSVRPVGAVGISLDAQGVVGDADMGGVVGAGGDDAVAAGIEQLASHQAGQPGFAFALAVGPAQGAQAGFGGIAAVDGSQGVVVFGKSQSWWCLLCCCS